MRYYFCIFKDNKVSNIRKNLTSKQLKHAIRNYVYNVNQGRVIRCNIPLVSSYMIYDIRNNRASKKYNIFKIFTNVKDFNKFLDNHGYKSNTNKIKLSNIIKYQPNSYKTKLSELKYEIPTDEEAETSDLSILTNFPDNETNKAELKIEFTGKGKANLYKLLLD